MSETIELPVEFDNLRELMEAAGERMTERDNQRRRAAFENRAIPNWLTNALDNGARAPLPKIPTRKEYKVRMANPDVDGGQRGLTIIFSEGAPMYDRNDVLMLIDYTYEGSGPVRDKLPSDLLEDIGVPTQERPPEFGPPCGADNMAGCYNIGIGNPQRGETRQWNGVTYVMTGGFLPYWKPQ